MTCFCENFACKGASCRISCCSGWPISISQEEYMRISDKCYGNHLRVKSEPTASDYACMQMTDGKDCPFHDSDRLCLLQKQFGHDFLPRVCRTYPRSFSGMDVCSAACEAVCERLWDADLSFSEDYSGSAVKDSISAVLRDRSFPFGARLSAIFNAVYGLEKTGVFLPAPAMYTKVQRSPANISALLLLASAFLPATESLCPLCKPVFDALGLSLQPDEWTNDRIIQAYGTCKSRAGTFKERYPNHEHCTENLFLNHVKYASFPAGGRLRSLREEALAFAALSAFTQFLLIMTAGSDMESYTDTVVRVMRFAEHGSFDQKAAALLKHSPFGSPERMTHMLMDIYE